jgi:tetratricopeptide (TPR) repeat protein
MAGFDCVDEYRTYTPTLVNMVASGATFSDISDQLMVFEGYIKGADQSIRRRCDVIAVMVASYGPHYAQNPFTPHINTVTPDAAYQSVMDLVTQTRLDAYDNQWEAVGSGYEQALAICQKHLAGRDLLLAACLNNLAQAYTELGQLDKAQELFESALPLLGTQASTDEAPYLTCLNNLITHLEYRGKMTEAEPYLKAMMACLESTAIDEDDERLLHARNRLKRLIQQASPAINLSCARLSVEGDGFGRIMNVVVIV